MIPGDILAFRARCAPWLAPAEISSVKQVLPGCGALMRRGAAQIAVYRDLDGRVLERSARCPHCGDSVEWNSMDRTWDCVAHGMRFSAEGRALNGPDGRPMLTASSDT